ncbi:hypothetical protein [Ktedonospora formicarum]|uniref:Blue (type 1) copper domain-containing protein n=1 Tax=Ktedonospora formicarum TaxID=2778364 RepID=A0A8J3MU19_9CHLR|nr:hypothetical protein [Ktedonospora formicarum]GHO48807.1 hypothetical protein KSX_69700 [Ktedonospora formicarum]
MKQRAIFGIFLTVFMLLLAACGSGGGKTDSPNAKNVDVSLSEFKVSVPLTTFTGGQSYHFVVTNTGKTTHEFMILPKSEGSMSGMPMEDMDKMALATTGDINPGETKTLDYTFPSSTVGSHPEFACYLPGHYEAGMKQSITVAS